MTGLEKWTAENGTSTQEIKILMLAQGINADATLGPSLTGDRPVPPGRDTAMKGMLKRGRIGDTFAPVHVIASVMGVTPELVMETVSADNGDGGIYADHLIASETGAIGDAKFMCDRLPSLILDIRAASEANPELHVAAVEAARQSANAGQAPMDPQLEPDAAAASAGDGADAPSGNATGTDAQDAPKQAPKTARAPARRKTKYTIGKSGIADMLQPADSNVPVRAIRAFLLSLPDYKPNDVALMSDADAVTAFNDNYAAVWVGNGALVMPSECYAQLIDFLGSIETYFIPQVEA